jgi:hypothetical protein
MRLITRSIDKSYIVYVLSHAIPSMKSDPSAVRTLDLALDWGRGRWRHDAGGYMYLR